MPECRLLEGEVQEDLSCLLAIESFHVSIALDTPGRLGAYRIDLKFLLTYGSQCSAQGLGMRLSAIFREVDYPQ